MVLGRATCLTLVLAVACARARTVAPVDAPAGSPAAVEPPAPPSLAAEPGWLRAEPAAARDALPARCALLADLLTLRPAATGFGSVLEGAAERGLAWQDGRLVVAATVAGPRPGEERSWFAATESCGDRMHLVTPGQELPPALRRGAVARLALVPQSSGGFAFRLRLETLGGSPVAGAPGELVGRAARFSSREWSIDVGVQHRAPRPLDPAPRAARLAHPLPPGRAEASFQFDTGADLMAAGPKEAGLVVVVRYADRELRQTIASCPDPSRGSALGGTAADVLDVASCGDLFRLRSEPGAVRVEREDARGVRSTVSRIEVGADRRAVHPLP